MNWKQNCKIYKKNRRTQRIYFLPFPVKHLGFQYLKSNNVYYGISMKSLIGYVQLARPLNGIIAFISAWLGGIFASGGKLLIISDLNLIYVSIAALLMLSAGNAINDYCDYNIDRINKPTRPIPSGRIGRKNAMVFAVILIGISIGLGALINIYALGIAILVSCMLVCYAFWLKRTPIYGNLTVSALTGITFISGGVAIGSIQGTIIPAIFAFLFTAAREIVKDLEDIEGDHKYQANTLAIQNPRFAVVLALSFMSSVLLFSPVPYLFGWYTWHYLITIVVGVDIVLIYLGYQLWKDVSKSSCAFIQQWMKWDIFVGLAAIYLGTIF